MDPDSVQDAAQAAQLSLATFVAAKAAARRMWGRMTMTVHEVAELSQLSEAAVYRAIKDDELAAHKVRGRWRVLPEDYDAWIGGLRADEPSPSPTVSRQVHDPRGLRILLRSKEHDRGGDG